MEHTPWLAKVTGTDSARAVARRCGLADRTLATHLERNGRLSSDLVLTIAAGYGINPVDALVETGHIAAEDTQLRSLSNATLTAEVQRRMG